MSKPVANNRNLKFSIIQKVGIFKLLKNLLNTKKSYKFL